MTYERHQRDAPLSQHRPNVVGPFGSSRSGVCLSILVSHRGERAGLPVPFFAHGTVRMRSYEVATVSIVCLSHHVVGFLDGAGRESLDCVVCHTADVS